MHPRIEHLLSIRDGEPVAADVREHVVHCRACAAALQDVVGIREQLRGLPSHRLSRWLGGGAAEDGWARRRGRTLAQPSEDCGGRLRRRDRDRCVLARCDDFVAPAAVTALQAPLAVEEALAMDRVAQLQTQSHALEDLLSAFGERASRGARRHGRTDRRDRSAGAVDRSPAVDLRDRGSQPGAAEQLWRERVDLMNSLVQLRYVEAQRIAHVNTRYSSMNRSIPDRRAWPGAHAAAGAAAGRRRRCPCRGADGAAGPGPAGKAARRRRARVSTTRRGTWRNCRRSCTAPTPVRRCARAGRPRAARCSASTSAATRPRRRRRGQGRQPGGSRRGGRPADRRRIVAVDGKSLRKTATALQAGNWSSTCAASSRDRS